MPPVDDRTPQTNPQPRISARRLWLFRVIVAVVAPILLLVLLEVVLRVAGFGFPASTFVKCEVNGKSIWCSNNKFGWRFFSPEISRQFEPFTVSAEKGADTYRIFVLGESAALGEPDSAYCFGRFLRVMLRRQYPSVNFEVFTAAMPAINSHAIVPIARDCARLKPDLFIIYMGNNEVVGPYGAGTVFTPLSKNLSIIRASIAIKATRVGQLLSRITDITSRSDTKPEQWGGLEMFLGKQIRHDDEQMKFVYSHFRKNLEDIIKIAQNSGAKIVLSTVAVNLRDCPPFASMHRPGLDEQRKKNFEGLYQEGIAAEKALDFQGAIDKYLAAAEIDDTYAELQFRLGRCLWNLGQFDKAREKYIQAMELDTLRFRADTKINQIIREVGRNYADKGVYLVETAEEFANQSPRNSPGFELFLEHVHLNFSGNYLLARTIFQRAQDVLADKIETKKTTDAGPLSEEQCAKMLAFTDYDNLIITQGNFVTISQGSPFINQAYHDEISAFWSQKAEQAGARMDPNALGRAVDTYRRAIIQDSNDLILRLKIGKLLWETRIDPPVAITQYRLVVERTPNDFFRLAELANMERALGDVNSALIHATRAVEILPTNALANYVAGVLYQIKGRPERAQKHLAQTVRLRPDFEPGYTLLAKVLIQQGKTEKAERVYRKGIESATEKAHLHFGLSALLKEKGRPEEAEKELQEAKTLDPNISDALQPPPTR